MVTISRQAGTGGHFIAEKLAEHLQAFSPKEAASWIIFDRNLVERVLEDHHLPARLARFMPEDRISQMEDTLDELFGLHPASWKLVEKIGETVLRLAEMGNVILIGRAANIVTSKLDYAFHVRLVGVLEDRINFIQADRKFDRKAAEQMIHHDDEGRRRYLKKYFHKDVDDSSLYHLVINAPALGHAVATQSSLLRPCFLVRIRGASLIAELPRSDQEICQPPQWLKEITRLAGIVLKGRWSHRRFPLAPFRGCYESSFRIIRILGEK